MNADATIEKAKAVINEMRELLATLEAEKATKRNWPERIEAGMCFGLRGFVYIYTDFGDLVIVRSSEGAQNEGKRYAPAKGFAGLEHEFTYLGHARDILTIRTDAHEPTGAELVGRVCEFSDDGENWTDGARPREQSDPRICIGYDENAKRPYSNKWTDWKLARLAK